MALVYTKGLPMTINYSVYDEQQTRDVRVIAGSVDRDVPTSIAIEEGSTAKIDNIIYNGHTYSFGEGFLLGDNQLIEVWQEHAEMHITYTTVVYGVETPE